MSDEGMTISEVRALAARLRGRADEIDALLHRLSERVAGVEWVGNDRDRFSRAWESEHAPGLRSVALALREAAAAAESGARRQAQASSQ